MNGSLKPRLKLNEPAKEIANRWLLINDTYINHMYKFNGNVG